MCPWKGGRATSLRPYLVSSGPSGSGCGGTVPLARAHRSREGRLGGEAASFLDSIFSTCQPENHLLPLPFSLSGAACACNHPLGPRISRSRESAGQRQACPGAEQPKTQESKEGVREGQGSQSSRKG